MEEACLVIPRQFSSHDLILAYSVVDSEFTIQVC